MIILSPKLLRKVRRNRKKKQAEIAQLLGVKRPTYVGYEKKDAIEVTPEAAKAVAEFLKVDISVLQSQEKVEDDDMLTGKYRLMDGDNVVLNKLAWDELQETLVKGREHLTDIIKNNTDLTQNNSKLTDSITDLVKNLLRPSGGNHQS